MHIARENERVVYNLQDGDSPEVRNIVSHLVPEWAVLFARKNADYGSHDTSAGVLGIKGQFADIWRKIPKLRRALWEDDQLEFEGVEEVIKDLIGHLFLTLNMLAAKEAEERASVYAPGLPRLYHHTVADTLEAAKARLRSAGLEGPDGAARLMTRSQLAGEPSTARDEADSGFASDAFGEADQAQHVPLACSNRGKGFDGPACSCHDNEGYSIRPLRDDDPVHPQDDEDEEGRPEGIPALSPTDLLQGLVAKVEQLTTTPEQQAEIKDMLDRLFKNSDKQRELLSRFERRIRGW